MRAFFSLIRGSLVFFAYVINTLFWAIPLLCISLLKLIPLQITRNICTQVLDFFASCWISCNKLTQKLFYPVNVIITGDTHFNKKEWYMVIANHQSWVDILILQQIFNGKIPFLKFFLKKELIYVPILGLVWWALDFPFMRRYSTAILRKHPELKGKDIEITKKACAKFKHTPISIMNFVEGTRFTKAKHKKQNSPYQYLLRPKAGGMAFALSAMGDHINKLINVSIYYPNGIPSFFDYISGKTKEVRVHIDMENVTDELKGDYLLDRAFKQNFQQKLNMMWEEKDKTMDKLAKQVNQG